MIFAALFVGSLKILKVLGINLWEEGKTKTERGGNGREDGRITRKE